uniref:Late endosomal/lysosomal adaptor and MAPK and MTOR activator 1 n=1 Tax=Syphacia muris TaxID=451379 RepID=A0A0N5AEI2_9BILA
MLYHTTAACILLQCFFHLSNGLPYNSVESVNEASALTTTDKPIGVISDYENRYEAAAAADSVLNFEGVDSKNETPEAEEYEGAENIDSAPHEATEKEYYEKKTKTEGNIVESQTTGYSGSSSSSSEEVEASSGIPIISDNNLSATVVKRDDNNVLLQDSELRKVVNEAIQYAIRDSVSKGISDDIHYERDV